MKSAMMGTLLLAAIFAFRCDAPSDSDHGLIMGESDIVASESSRTTRLKAMVEGDTTREASIGRIFINRVTTGREAMAYARLYAEAGIPLEPGAYSILQSEFFLDDDQGVSWGVLVRDAGRFEVGEADTSEAVLTIPRPTLEVETRLGRPAGSGDDALVIAPGTSVYLGRQVSAPNGMVFTRSMRSREGGGAPAQIEPQVRILGSDGGVIQTGAMEYG